MDLYFWMMIAGLFALQLPCWAILYWTDKHTWNKGVSRITGLPWKYASPHAHGCEHKFEAGEHKHTFYFRFDN